MVQHIAVKRPMLKRVGAPFPAWKQSQLSILSPVILTVRPSQQTPCLPILPRHFWALAHPPMTADRRISADPLGIGLNVADNYRVLDSRSSLSESSMGQLDTSQSNLVERHQV